jgi:hypothetical protein
VAQTTVPVSGTGRRTLTVPLTLAGRHRLPGAVHVPVTVAVQFADLVQRRATGAGSGILR